MPKLTALFLLALPLLGASGCVIVTDQQFYEACGTVSDCELAAEQCAPLTGDWPDGRLTTDYICTSDCIFGSDCPGANGFVSGVCYDQDGDPGTPNLCLEPCEFESDCDFGFSCADFAGTRFCLPY